MSSIEITYKAAPHGTIHSQGIGGMEATKDIIVASKSAAILITHLQQNRHRDIVAIIMEGTNVAVTLQGSLLTKFDRTEILGAISGLQKELHGKPITTDSIIDWITAARTWIA